MDDVLTPESANAAELTVEGSPPSQHTNVSVGMPPKELSPRVATLAGILTLASLLPWNAYEPMVCSEVRPLRSTLVMALP